MMTTLTHAPSGVLRRSDFNALIRRLSAEKRTVVAPTVRDGAIIYDVVESDSDLPAGWRDEQAAGRYRLHRGDDEALFGFAVGPHSWKRFLHPPKSVVWRATRAHGALTIERAADDDARYAFLGVRACELAAIAMVDTVMLGDAHPDPTYQAIRADTLIIAVNCGAPAATCFCASMDAGPKATAGFDLALTELLDAPGHRFVLEAATANGEAILFDLPTHTVTDADREAAAAVIAASKATMGRTLETEGLKERLAENLEHPHWDAVGQRCLACGNCTHVCPTCFCTNVEDHTNLAGDDAERVRVWDSCFTNQFSELNGGLVRETTRSRYRQWMTHKLSTWVDQFGRFGCAGCGRCIAWCPVGIDITDEAAAIGRQRDDAP